MIHIYFCCELFNDIIKYSKCKNNFYSVYNIQYEHLQDWSILGLLDYRYSKSFL